MSHDDGKKTEDLMDSDVILLGVSRTSKTPTSIYLANRGFKTTNIPLIPGQEIPDSLKGNTSYACIIGLIAEPNRLSDIRRNRIALMQENRSSNYTDVSSIQKEVEDSKNLFKKHNWPIIDVTRKSVEETAASIIKIIEIKKNK
jgi:regulator of PEP synthase PpsR (kinase-PPPase family)